MAGRRGTVVLSPHFDDAALSVGGSLASRAGPIAIVTVHGGPPPAGVAVSDWDAVCGFVSAAEAYRLRRQEDARACTVLGAEQVLLEHADGPYRSGPLDALSDFLGSLDPGTEVLLPLGTNQPDHAAVRDQALAVLAGREVRPLIYADLPYTAVADGWGGPNPTAALAASARCGKAYRTVRQTYDLTVSQQAPLGVDEWRRKRDAVLCYASQIAPVATMSEIRGSAPLLAHPGPLQHELVWAADVRRDRS